MAVTSVATGSSTQTSGGAETNFAAASATSGVWVIAVDLGLMANGDVIELRVYNIIGGGSERLSYYAVYANAQAQPGKYSVPVPSNGGGDTIRFTIKQTAGTTRACPYRIMTIG